MQECERNTGYDLIRSFSILFIFLGHIFIKQCQNDAVKIIICSISPGMTISLLGFISAALLSQKEISSGAFLIKRFIRIFLPLFLCLTIVGSLHILMGKAVISQHLIIHFMGLSAFLDLLHVKNLTTIGIGLWFVTAILTMYILLPVLQILFRHRNGLIHLIILILICTSAGFVLFSTESCWNVAISFMVGTYLGATGRLDQLTSRESVLTLIIPLCIIAFAVLSTTHIISYEIRGFLFAFYPLAFVPAFFALARRMPKSILKTSTFFSELSYEFYILHFYFINENLRDLTFGPLNIASHIAISFFVTGLLAYGFSMIASRARKMIERYLLREPLT